MSNEKFTPGPWVISKHGQIEFKHSSGHMRSVLFRGVASSMTKNDEADSNSQLISQAPAMYEMLKTIGMVLDGKTEFAPDEIDTIAIDDLLAKARGES